MINKQMNRIELSNILSNRPLDILPYVAAATTAGVAVVERMITDGYWA